MSVKCPQCDFKNPDDTFYCGKCAAPLKPSKEVSITKTLQTHLASPGKTIAGKYKILSELGRGGMGVVYKAKDTRLKRTVALKFLPAELTKDKEAKKRFIQEAQAAAALNHPQICTIYEVDEAEDQIFIAMEYIEGQSLKDKLKEGPVAIDDAKDIALQVAAGLEKAHKKGIVHRDIKPANIMLTDEGQAKITDFGLAKLSWGVDLTKTSTVMGTVAYMSPEQAKGEEVDHRTDIWSLGAMMYEMLSGEGPFKKDQEHALIYSILNDEPKALAEIREDIPNHIKETIHKALEKDSSNRYQSIQQLIKDLKQSAPITFPKSEKSIVVLPFDDMSPNKDNEYFSDGLTEEIISDLSGFSSLRVISRSSAMTFKGTNKTAPEIAAQLKVNYVLEGSVRKSGNNLRITAQLIDATNDTHLWAEKYSGTLDDVFEIQEKVSRSIVDALKIRLSPDDNQKISDKPIDNIHAYDIYLKANYEIWRMTEESLSRAIQLLHDGIEIVGENELLNYGMGNAYFQYVNIGIIPDEKYLDKAEQYVQKIFKLNPNSSYGYTLRSLIYETRGNFLIAVKDAKQAVLLDPNNPMAIVMLVFLYAIAGKNDVAKPLFDRLMRIDPLNPLNQFILYWIHFSEGRFDLAIKAIRKGYGKSPENPIARLCYAWALALNQQYQEALRVIDQIVKDTPQNVYASLGLFMKHAMIGNKQNAIQSLSEDAIKLAEIDHLFSLFLAQFYSLLREKEEALDWLEKAVKCRIDYPLLSEYDPFLENIRSEPRFKKLMERVKHEWENFEV